MKESYTTGQIADMWGVSVHAIILAFDRGSLKGFKIPGSKHRRVLGTDLRGSMEENGIPLEMLERKRNKTYSTGKIAKMWGVSRSAIIKAIDKGLLKSFVLPGSKDRKVWEENLIEYMKTHGIPLSLLKNKRNTTYSTGQVAKILKRSVQTIIRFIGKHRLKAFKVPGSKYRKVLKRELSRFRRVNKSEIST